MILETDRLTLRKFTLNDTAFIIELLNSPGWLEFIGDRNVRTKEEAIAYLQNGALKSYSENGFGLSMVETKTEGLPIGMAGLIKRDFLEHPDIGFAFLPGHDRKGYGYEIASAILKHAAEKWKIQTVCAITLPNNTRSVRLLEKLGLKFSSTIIYPGTDEELSLYARSLK
jgi:RimJ/RimL family protein N-acetyltransferase